MSDKKAEGKEKKKEVVKYTFNDWLEYRLPKPSEDPDLFRRTDEYGGEKHLDSLVYNGKMKMEERDKINQAKQEAFHKSVEINSSLLFHCHKHRAENSKDKEQYLYSIISEVTNVIDSKTLRKINAGDADITGIFAKDYISLKESEVQNPELLYPDLEIDIDWDDGKFLITFNEFQIHTYMYSAAEKLKDLADSKKEMVIENPDINTAKVKTLSPIEKIKLIEEVRKREGVRNYDEAIKIASKEAGQFLYKNYNSFKKARYDFREFL